MKKLTGVFILTLLLLYALSSSVFATNLVINGSFESGNTGFTSQYTYDTTDLTPPGVYYIGANPLSYNAWFGGYGGSIFRPTMEPT